MALLSGPRLPPAKGPATHLVVLLHGYGADGNDLIGLAEHWREFLPGAVFVAPNAPDRVPGAPSGFQWFPISRIDPHEMQNGVAAAAPGIESFLDAELAKLNLPPERLALVGFSQGTMLALHLGLRRAVAPAAIVGFSGLLAGPPPAEGLRPPVLLTHGDADTVIPASAMFTAAITLGAAGVPLQWHLARGMGHGIDQDGLVMAGLFMALAFGGYLQVNGPVSSPL
ncbi:MAG: dienelactone hydrolase family protein [Pseudomonadota bacterium]